MHIYEDTNISVLHHYCQHHDDQPLQARALLASAFTSPATHLSLRRLDGPLCPQGPARSRLASVRQVTGTLAQSPQSCPVDPDRCLLVPIWCPRH